MGKTSFLGVVFALIALQNVCHGEQDPSFHHERPSLTSQFSFSGLQADCFYEPDRNMVSCRCLEVDPSTNGMRDLSDLVNENWSEGMRNLFFRHVEIRNCAIVDVSINLRYVERHSVWS